MVILVSTLEEAEMHIYKTLLSMSLEHLSNVYLSFFLFFFSFKSSLIQACPKKTCPSFLQSSQPSNRVCFRDRVLQFTQGRDKHLPIELARQEARLNPSRVAAICFVFFFGFERLTTNTVSHLRAPP